MFVAGPAIETPCGRERLRTTTAGEQAYNRPCPEVHRVKAEVRVKYPVLLIQSITAFVLGVACLVLGLGAGFSGSDGLLFLIVCIVLLVVGVLAFAHWLRKVRA